MKFSAWPGLLYNDQNMAMITRWRWWWLGCWCSCSLRAGLGPGTGLGFCLWLSFTQIAESCLWEPKIWSPGIPGGIFGRTAQLSSLFCGWGGFWVGLWLLLGTGQYLGVHGCSHFGPCLCCLYWFAINCSEIAKQLTAVQICFYLVSWIGDNLLINCYMTILLFSTIG